MVYLPVTCVFDNGVGKDFNVTKMADKLFMELAKPLSKTPATGK
jgi:hypothetical protein